MKKAAFVAAAVTSLSLVAAPAMAAPVSAQQAAPAPVVTQLGGSDLDFGDAVDLWTSGGAALGYGAAALIAGAYTGIALTPALVLGSLTG